MLVQIALHALTVLLVALTVVLLLPTASELVGIAKVLTGSKGRGEHRSERETSGPLPTFLFLVLAHDEELLLPSCLRTIFAQSYAPGRMQVVVVADNCSDRTAATARQEGARVLERRDEALRGKPFAIAWALERVDLKDVDAVVIIDADTAVAPDFASALAEHSPVRDRVLQPFIAVQNPDENALTRMAAVYETAVHGLAYRMKERSGLNVPLGVGMSLGAEVLAAEPWSAFSIAEDYELYAILTLRGVHIDPVQNARISAQEARSLRQGASQRDRWMAGKLDVLERYAHRILFTQGIGAHQRLDAVAELTAFGPVVHLGAAASGAALALWIGIPGGELVAGVMLLSLARPVIYTLLAVRAAARPWIALRAFLYLPIYASWRIALAILSALRPRRGRWIRTGRHEQS